MKLNAANQVPAGVNQSLRVCARHEIIKNLIIYTHPAHTRTLTLAQAQQTGRDIY